MKLQAFSHGQGPRPLLGVRKWREAAVLQHSPAQLCLQPSSWEAALLKMACSLCSCGASHRRFSAASVQEPC